MSDNTQLDLTISNINHLKFCEEYAITLDAMGSYMKAYPKTKKKSSASSSASTLLKRPEIIDYINFLMRDVAKKSGITKRILDGRLIDIALNENSSNTGNSIRAIELLGRSIGAYQEQIEVTTKDITIRANIIE